VRWKRSSDSPDLYAASTAIQIAGAAWPLNRSRSNVTCPLWIRRSSSMPAIVMAADSKFLKPGIGLVLDLIPRWSCSMRLFRYFEDRNFVRQGSRPSSRISQPCAMRRSIAIEGDRVRRPTVIPNRLFEECLGCGYISCPTEPEVDSLPNLVYCPIQIGPRSAYLEIGFIDSPRAASAAAKAIPPLDELCRIPSNPAQDRRMGKLESSFGHHLHQITEAELVAQIPTHAQKDHLAVKVRPANSSSMFLSLPMVSPRSQRPLCPTAFAICTRAAKRV
jgi:hypothetical protein